MIRDYFFIFYFLFLLSMRAWPCKGIHDCIQIYGDLVRPQLYLLFYLAGIVLSSLPSSLSSLRRSCSGSSLLPGHIQAWFVFVCNFLLTSTPFHILAMFRQAVTCTVVYKCKVGQNIPTLKFNLAPGSYSFDKSSAISTGFLSPIGLLSIVP